MDYLKLAEEELDRRNAFDGRLNETIKHMCELVDAPKDMAMGIAAYTMATFVSHFQTKIELSENNKVPTNAIFFILAHSGSKKTSSVTGLEKSLAAGYNEINEARRLLAKMKSMETGDPVQPIHPLSNTLSTEPGMVQRLNDFKKEGIGLPSLFVDEISTELATSVDIVPNIKMVAQLFDEGNMKAKVIKDRERQSEEVHGMGMCALFMGSEHGILEDELVLKMFIDELISKLARRCFFIYPKFIKKEKTKTNFDEIREERKVRREKIEKISKKINQRSKNVALRMMKEESPTIRLSEETERLAEAYEVYCEEMSEKETSEPTMLETRHRFWKVLKLAAVFAIFNGNKKIEESDYIEAISIAENGKKHLKKFEEKARRQKYEILLDMFLEGTEQITVHEMVKKKLIKNPKEVIDIIELANSKSRDYGFIEQFDGKLKFNNFEKTDKIGISVKRVTSLSKIMEEKGFDKREAKSYIAKKEATEGFRYIKKEFKEMYRYMTEDTAYSPFELSGGRRGNENIISQANFVILDIDDDGMMDEECADMLADYCYIIARTSDIANPYKYRVLMPTDIKVDVTPEKWLLLMRKIRDHLGLDFDVLGKAQIYFGYKQEEYITNEDGQFLEVSAMLRELEKTKKKVQRAPSKEALRDIFKKRRDVFWYLYKANNGNSLHLNIFKAMDHIFRLGFDRGICEEIINEGLEEMPGVPREGFMNSLEKQMDTRYNG